MKKINEYLKIKEATKLIGVTETTLRNWESKQIIKSYRNPQNDYRLYDKEELEAFLSRIKKA